MKSRYAPNRHWRIFAAFVACLGIVVSVASYISVSPAAMCEGDMEASAHIAESATAIVGVHWTSSSERTWPPFAGARCTGTTADDVQNTATVINWPASAAAVAGLVLTVVALLVLYRSLRRRT